MRDLSAQDVVDAWEVGEDQHPVDRALTLLAAAFPETSREELIALSVGQRDARLLSVRERLFGPRLRGFAPCPGCDERLEFDLEVEDVRVAPDAEADEVPYALSAGGYELRFRLPDSLDLAAVARSENTPRGRLLLVDRCVVGCRRDGVDVEARSLPEAVISALSEALEARDPQADVRLDLVCPACDLGWQVSLDIGAFLWAEVRARARRLLGEVQTLARAYGWREADILSMSPVRRRFYLET